MRFLFFVDVDVNLALVLPKFHDLIVTLIMKIKLQKYAETT